MKIFNSISYYLIEKLIVFKTLNFKLITLNLIVLAFSSCTKEITLDLKEADIKYVMEADMDDSLGFRMHISLSQPYYNDNTFPVITDAAVTLSDNEGNSRNIAHSGDGWYKDSTFKTVVGRTYTLKVVGKDVEYIASSTVRPTIGIGYIVAQKFNFGGGNDGPIRVLQLWYQDPAGAGDHIRVVVNNKKDPSSASNINLQDDRFNDGLVSQLFLFSGGGDDDGYRIQPGDTVHLSLQTIDKAVYDYFLTLDQISGQGGGFGGGVTPANPTTNWSNAGLGVFNACTVRGRYFVVPD